MTTVRIFVFDNNWWIIVIQCEIYILACYEHNQPVLLVLKPTIICDTSNLKNVPWQQQVLLKLLKNCSTDGTVNSDAKLFYYWHKQTRMDQEYVDFVLRITWTQQYASVYWCWFFQIFHLQIRTMLFLVTHTEQKLHSTISDFILLCIIFPLH